MQTACKAKRPQRQAVSIAADKYIYLSADKLSKQTNFNVFSDQISPKCDNKPGAPLAVLPAALVERALPLHQHPLVEVVVLQIPGGVIGEIVRERH